LGRRNQSRNFWSTNIFFSVLDKDQKVINDLTELEGQYVKLSYVERYKTFAWWGDTKYFIRCQKKILHTDLNRKHEKSL
jgi:hypothetical protein